MTNQEINEKVAMKLGHAICRKLEHLGDVHLKDDGRCGPMPDYSGSIEAAWEIVDKYKLHLIPTDKGWFCGSGEVVEEGECIEIWHPSRCCTRGVCGCLRCEIADTAPMAICLAFLKLKEDEHADALIAELNKEPSK